MVTCQQNDIFTINSWDIEIYSIDEAFLILQVLLLRLNGDSLKYGTNSSGQGYNLDWGLGLKTLAKAANRQVKKYEESNVFDTEESRE